MYMPLYFLVGGSGHTLSNLWRNIARAICHPAAGIGNYCSYVSLAMNFHIYTARYFGNDSLYSLYLTYVYIKELSFVKIVRGNASIQQDCSDCSERVVL